MSMTENEPNVFSIAYRDCKEVADSINVNEEFGKASTILFYMDEILEALKIASELQAIGTPEECKKAVELVKELNNRKMTVETLENYMQFEDECVKMGYTFKSILETREKMKPKKPTITSTVENAEYMKCPHCHLTTVLYDGMRPDYCPKCSGAFNWSE